MDPLFSVSNSKRQERTVFTNDQLLRLEKEYISQGKYLCRLKRIQVARDLGLNDRQVTVWFQNRRAKDKRVKSLNDDENKEKVPMAALPSTKIECRMIQEEIKKEKTYQNTGLVASVPVPAPVIIHGEHQMHTLNYSSNSSTGIPQHNHLSSWDSYNRINYDTIHNQNYENFNGPDWNYNYINEHCSVPNGYANEAKAKGAFHTHYLSNCTSNNDDYYPPGWNK